MTRRIAVKPARDFPPNTREVITVGRQSIGVLNIEGEFFALRNHCPHQGAPLCLGMISGTTLPGEPYEYELWPGKRDHLLSLARLGIRDCLRGIDLQSAPGESSKL